MNPAYHEGYDAFCEGKKLKKCPYKEGTEKHKEWVKGWQEAERISNTPVNYRKG